MTEMRFQVAKAGFPLIVLSALASVLFGMIGSTWLMITSVAGTAFIIFFFRDPRRIVPDGPGFVVAPADGRVISLETVNETPLFSGTCRKISIFMSVFNVHVNRIPCNGKVAGIRYSPGKFFPASKNNASDQNENNALSIETPNQKKVCVVQVAGLIARRIICYVKKEENVLKGKRFGIICFGSRVDTYLPEDSEILVKKGDRVRAGVSIIGHIK
ncbi:MAG: phosphatidylserine decarboxylase [Deltaproteobacteria bacterium RBG_13_49_15]|nr:MAG: phosphatidylserine decarboxylase [Deltaproteobacteria bacterium RBG_13_49_15]